MSGSDIQPEHPSDWFSWSPAKGLNGLSPPPTPISFPKVLFTKTKTQACCGCPTKLQTPPFVLLNGKPDNEWQSGCWCFSPNACKQVCVEERRNPAGVFQRIPWTGSRRQFQSSQAPSPLQHLLAGPACLQLSYNWPLIGSHISSKHLIRDSSVRTLGFLEPSKSSSQRHSDLFLLFNKSISTSQPPSTHCSLHPLLCCCVTNDEQWGKVGLAVVSKHLLDKPITNGPAFSRYPTSLQLMFLTVLPLSSSFLLIYGK